MKCCTCTEDGYLCSSPSISFRSSWAPVTHPDSVRVCDWCPNSSYLNAVPLLSGGTGDTGDLSAVSYTTDTRTETWDPVSQPGHYPQTITDTLLVAVTGAWNEVDTAAMGYDAIEAACKPSMTVALESTSTPGIEMIFGAAYDTTTAQDFWEDNIGITPLVLSSSDRTVLTFTVSLTATPGPCEHV